MKHRRLSAISIILIIGTTICLFFADVAQGNDDGVDSDSCYTTCSGYGEWIYGRGWVIPPYKTEEIGTCLQQPIATELEKNNDHEGSLALGPEIQDAMIQVYEKVVAMMLLPTTTTFDDDYDDNNNNKEDNNNRTNATVVVPSKEEEGEINEKTEKVEDEDAAAAAAATTKTTTRTKSAVVAQFLNALLPGSYSKNSQGLYYCLPNDQFYWVPNCDVLTTQEEASANAALCADLTPQEETIEGQQHHQQQQQRQIGFVVDESIHGNKNFYRYVFNETHATITSSQPIPGAANFSCSRRPWFRDWTCTDPVGVACPTTFEGSLGIGTFFSYGLSTVAVVAQDLHDWQLCRCLEDLECPASSGEGGGRRKSMMTVTTMMATTLLLHTMTSFSFLS